MSHISGGDTKPELVVRKLLHSMGYRYRLHVRTLPGKPDIVLPRHKKIIFVHGCFWHGHSDCPRAKRPSSNIEFWNSKIENNIRRDRKNLTALAELGWKTLVVWSCDIKDVKFLDRKLRNFLGS